MKDEKCFECVKTLYCIMCVKNGNQMEKMAVKIEESLNIFSFHVLSVNIFFDSNQTLNMWEKCPSQSVRQ